MKIAIVTLTKGASALGRQLRDAYGGTLYCKSDFQLDNQDKIVEKPFGNFVGQLFSTYEGIVFIMATGIVVRSLAPYIQAKTSDPAIVVMDEGGQHAISLLSGHLGGGNALAHRVADAVGATAVITTASDVRGSLAVDMLAQSIGCSISSMEAAKNVTAVGVSGGQIHVYYDPQKTDMKNTALPGNVKQVAVNTSMKTQVQDFVHDNPGNETGAVFISADYLHLPDHAVQLIPKSLTVGIGCRKEVPYEVIASVFKEACTEASVDTRAVRQLATIELKSKEPGIIALGKQLDVPVRIVDLESIKRVQNCFKGSDFVEKTIGVRAVAEPCAMLAAGKGKMRLMRYANNGVTIAIWEEENAD